MTLAFHGMQKLSCCIYASLASRCQAVSNLIARRDADVKRNWREKNSPKPWEAVALNFAFGKRGEVFTNCQTVQAGSATAGFVGSTLVAVENS